MNYEQTQGIMYDNWQGMFLRGFKSEGYKIIQQKSKFPKKKIFSRIYEWLGSCKIKIVGTTLFHTNISWRLISSSDIASRFVP